MRGSALKTVHQFRNRDLRRVVDQQVNVIVVTIALDQHSLEILAYLREYLTQPVKRIVIKNATSILGNEDQMHVH